MTGRRMLRGTACAWVLVCTLGCTATPTPPPPTPPPTPTSPPVALGPVEVTGIGDVAEGAVSGNDLVLRFTEPSPTAIGPGAGSLQVVLTDSEGVGTFLLFTGTPSIAAPGSLGVSATLNGGNVLTISIVDSDRFNVEPITITGLGIRALPTAALGAINAVISGCSGSLAGCTATPVLASPGTVIALH